MTALIAALVLSAPPAVPALGEPCKDGLDPAIFTSPRWPSTGSRLRILIVSGEELPGAESAVRGPTGEEQPLKLTRYGGPPFGWVGELSKPAAGEWRIAWGSAGELLACQRVEVRARPARAAALRLETDPVWEARWKWERDTENFYSLWVEHLFDAPEDAEPTWRPLHDVLRDRERNLLHDHFSLGEDGPGERALTLVPDCADFSYFLRAYFAWKLSLPFGYRPCSRGTTRRPPSCGEPFSNQQPAKTSFKVSAFERFMRGELARIAHSSSPRTLPTAEQSDFYPVTLTRSALRPGAIFADPYGHVLVVAKWVPQKEGKPGILFAVDAQPDGTIGRRRFWRGSFLFPEDGAVTGAGFKRARPVQKGRNGAVYGYSNQHIAKSADHGDFSTEQWSRGKDGFYEWMDELVSPRPMPPEVAWKAALDALAEQVRRRVQSVDTGEEYKREHPGKVIPMPEPEKIFQTAGPWEDYSTPSRDLRLLIAIRTVVDFPDRLVRYPKRFVLPPGKTPEQAKGELRAALPADAGAQTFEYTRSDGSKQTLSLRDVLDRSEALEMGYNPNDCPEIRWGAPAGSAERSTCKAEAPAKQRERMAACRVWFRERRRPLE